MTTPNTGSLPGAEQRLDNLERRATAAEQMVAELAARMCEMEARHQREPRNLDELEQLLAARADIMAALAPESPRAAAPSSDRRGSDPAPPAPLPPDAVPGAQRTAPQGLERCQCTKMHGDGCPGEVYARVRRDDDIIWVCGDCQLTGDAVLKYARDDIEQIPRYRRTTPPGEHMTDGDVFVVHGGDLVPACDQCHFNVADPFDGWCKRCRDEVEARVVGHLRGQRVICYDPSDRTWVRAGTVIGWEPDGRARVALDRAGTWKGSTWIVQPGELT